MGVRLALLLCLCAFTLLGCNAGDSSGPEERSTVLATEGVSCPNPAEITHRTFSLNCDVIDASVTTCEENSLAWFAYQVIGSGGPPGYTILPMNIDLTNLKRHTIQVTFDTEDTDISVHYMFITINGQGSDQDPPSGSYSHDQQRSCWPTVHDWSGGPEKFYTNRFDREVLRLGWHADGCDPAFSVLLWGYDEQVENSTPVPYENGQVVYFDLPVDPCEETVYYRLIVDPFCSDNATTTAVESDFTDYPPCGSGGKGDPFDPGP